jgi:hypothetical protein
MALISSKLKGENTMLCLLTSMILVVAPGLFAGQKSELRRADIQNVLGEPIRAQGNQATYRTKDEGLYVSVGFTQQDIVTRLVITGSCSPTEVLFQTVDRLAPEGVRGQLLKHEGVGEFGDCWTGYRDEYENVIISYRRTHCMNCNHPQLVVEWRKFKRDTRAPSNNSFNASRNSSTFIRETWL